MYYILSPIVLSLLAIALLGIAFDIFWKAPQPVITPAPQPVIEPDPQEWKKREFFKGEPLTWNFMPALNIALEKGMLLSIVYKTPKGLLHTRIVELWEYDEKMQVFRTREVSTCHFRQVCLPLIESVRWIGSEGTQNSL